MSAAIVEFNKEVADKLKAKYGNDKANVYMGVYHKLNGSPFKNFAWLKEFDFVQRQQSEMSADEKKRNAEAIVAGLELFKDLRAYGKVYQHYVAELEKMNAPSSVVEAVLPKAEEIVKPMESEVPKNEVIAIPEKPTKTRKIKKPKAEIPEVVSDICGAKVPVDKELVKKSQKKKSTQDVTLSTDQSPSALTEKKAHTIVIKPNMSEKQKKQMLERVRSILYDV